MERGFLGISDLILHGGKVPPHLMKRMKGLSEAIVKFIVDEYGPTELIQRLSDPFWFQAFNNVIGMDWDSSGSTSVVMGILKELTWREDLGFVVLGGKGKNMLKVREEAEEAARKFDIDPMEVSLFSKVTARIDSALLQDGYDLYVHYVALSEDAWLTVQQGMDLERKLARRYHVTNRNFPWKNPHSGISGLRGEALDVSAPTGKKVMEVGVEVINEGKAFSLLKVARASLKGQRRLDGSFVIDPSKLKYYYPVRPTKQLELALEKIAQASPSSAEELLLSPGLGPRVVRALALIAHVIYGYEPSFDDPVTFDPFAYAYAVGGKDGIPYPYDLNVADEAIGLLREALEESSIEVKLKKAALKRLSEWIGRTLGEVQR
ncbi:hypothetical protein EYM_06610 [Ignicoccus islandicus DSM 13165]|uniref:DUF763 domain-containing protein n=1 Tax=Ignicoccus islandicus DSM 13165 TaxID=940295 RepID=A0A0U3FPU9_9CREN|nr:DUF763 domain-containing protein [Ignicoccus islandicus]ALU11959.1 hypothetical protein EYM_06610 [Ignicoccus islandicus DSM 13165]